MDCTVVFFLGIAAGIILGVGLVVVLANNLQKEHNPDE